MFVFLHIFLHCLQAIEILRNSAGTVRLKVRKCNTDSAQYAQNNVQGQISLPNPPGNNHLFNYAVC